MWFIIQAQPKKESIKEVNTQIIIESKERKWGYKILQDGVGYDNEKNLDFIKTCVY